MNAHYRDLPSNLEAEQALLGALMLNNSAFGSLPAPFIVDHFYEELHAEIFRAMQKAKAVGKSANPVTIRSFMAPDIAAKKVGDMTVSQYLAMLVTSAVSVVNVPDYADAITDFYHRRQAITVGEDAQTIAIRAEDELQFLESIRECRARLTAIITDIEARNEPEESFNEAIDGTLDRTADAMSGKALEGLDPGIPEVKSLTGLWQPENLIIIGGDVKQGKSALAWQIAFNLAATVPVGGNSGEMSRSQIIMREKARRTGVSAKRQKLGQVSESEIQALVKAGQEMKRLHHMDINCQQITLDQVDQRVERLVGEFGIKAFVVDHILKLAWTGKMEDADDFKKANRATSTLKNIAMKRGVTMIALTHLNKTGYQEFTGRGQSYRDRLNAAIRRRPTYKNLLGNIDKDADHALIVFQPRPIIIGMEPEEGTEDYALWQNYMDQTKGKAEIILSLSRESEPSRREIQWNGATTSYGPAFNEQFNERGLF